MYDYLESIDTQMLKLTRFEIAILVSTNSNQINWIGNFHNFLVQLKNQVHSFCFSCFWLLSKLNWTKGQPYIKSPLNIQFAQAIKTQILLIPQYFDTHHIRECYYRIHLCYTNSTDSETYTIFAAAELLPPIF